MRQVRQIVLLGEGLAGLPPLAQEAALRKQHDPLPLTTVVNLVQVVLQVHQLLVPVRFALAGQERGSYCCKMTGSEARGGGGSGGGNNSTACSTSNNPERDAKKKKKGTAFIAQHPRVNFNPTQMPEAVCSV